MSWWSDFRDGLEAVVGVVVNYFYPGAGILMNLFGSTGAKEYLNSGVGMAAMGLSGGAGAAAGNMSNYGSTLSAMSGGAGEAGSAAYGFTGTATLGAQQEAVGVAQQMIANGASPAEAIQMAGISPEVAQASGLTAGAGQTWADVASQSGIPYSGSPGMSSAATFSNTDRPNGAMTPGAKTAAGTGIMPWGSPGNVSTMGQGIYGLMESARLGGLAETAAARADPFRQYREQYAQRMSMLSNNPSAIVNEPGYQAGLQAIQRTMAAQGYTGSGNMMAALAKYGGDFYNQTMANYANWAGAGVNPAAGAQLGLQGAGMGINLAGQSLNRLGYGGYMAGNQWPGQG